MAKREMRVEVERDARFDDHEAIVAAAKAAGGEVRGVEVLDCGGWLAFIVVVESAFMLRDVLARQTPSTFLRSTLAMARS